MQQSVLSEDVARLAERARRAAQPAIRIEAAPAAAALPPDASKFGGRPFTPEGFVWPMNPAGHPMHFIGQINFAEVIAQVPSLAERLPGQGLFQFFYVSDEELAAGLGVDDQQYARFFWYPDLHAVQYTPFEPVTSHLARESQLRFCEGTSLPDSTFFALQGSGEDAGVLGAYQREWGLRDRPRHQLLGHSWGIQYDPRESTQRGDPRSSALWLLWGRKRRESALAEYRRKLDEWQLLWQIDSDEDVGFEWIDEGTVYILVRREALLSGDLSAPWLNLQCF